MSDHHNCVKNAVSCEDNMNDKNDGKILGKEKGKLQKCNVLAAMGNSIGNSVWVNNNDESCLTLLPVACNDECKR